MPHPSQSSRFYHPKLKSSNLKCHRPILLCNTARAIISFPKYPLAENGLGNGPRNVAIFFKKK
jgi:hypothetical protein